MLWFKFIQGLKKRWEKRTSQICSQMQSKRCPQNLQTNHRGGSRRIRLRRLCRSSHSELAKTIQTATTTTLRLLREIVSFFMLGKGVFSFVFSPKRRKYPRKGFCCQYVFFVVISNHDVPIELCRAGWSYCSRSTVSRFFIDLIGFYFTSMVSPTCVENRIH